MRFLLVCFLTSFIYRVAIEQATLLFSETDNNNTLANTSAFLDSIGQQNFSIESLKELANQAEKEAQSWIAGLAVSDMGTKPKNVSNGWSSNFTTFERSPRTSPSTPRTSGSHPLFQSSSMYFR